MFYFIYAIIALLVAFYAVLYPTPEPTATPTVVIAAVPTSTAFPTSIPVPTVTPTPTPAPTVVPTPEPVAIWETAPTLECDSTDQRARAFWRAEPAPDSYRVWVYYFLPEKGQAYGKDVGPYRGIFTGDEGVTFHLADRAEDVELIVYALYEGDRIEGEAVCR